MGEGVVGALFLSVFMLSVFIIRDLVIQIQISDEICPNKTVIGQLNINSI